MKHVFPEQRVQPVRAVRYISHFIQIENPLVARFRPLHQRPGGGYKPPGGIQQIIQEIIINGFPILSQYRA